MANEELRYKRSVICVMVSVGDRRHLTDITYPRFSRWCQKNGYEHALLKEDLLVKYGYNRPLHFNKLLVHKYYCGYDEYLVIDDDLLFLRKTPSLPECGINEIFLAKDPKQDEISAPYIRYNANTGFLLFGKEVTKYLEEVFSLNYVDGRHKTIEGFDVWGPYDQGPVNEIVFKKNLVKELDYRFNYAFVLDYWLNGNTKKWLNSRFYRVLYFLSLAIPFHPNSRKIQKVYVLHLINCRHIRYIDVLLNIFKYA